MYDSYLIARVKRSGSNIIGVTAVKDGEIDVKYYSAGQIFNMQQNPNVFFYVLHEDGFTATNVRAENENGVFCLSPKIAEVKRILDNLLDVE